MLVSIRLFSRAAFRLRCLGLAVAALPAIPGLAQQTNQPAQPVMYLSCAYTQNSVIYLNNTFAVPAAQVGQAQSAFRQFAQSQVANQRVSSGCRPSRDESSLNSARQTERQALTSRSGQTVKFVDINWRFSPIQSATVPQVRAPAPSQYNQTAASGPQTAVSYAQPSSPSKQNPAAGTPANVAQSGTATGSSPMSGVTSNLAQTGQSMKDNAVNTGATMAASMSQMATDTTTQLQKSATDKITSLFHRNHGKADAAPQQPAQPAALQTILVAENKQTATSAGAPVPPAGPSFVSCRATASGTEYLSEIFPVMESDDTKMRYAFWQLVGQQYKTGPVAFSTVSCTRAATEQEANSLLTAAVDTATKSGIPPNRIVKTGWSYMGK